MAAVTPAQWATERNWAAHDGDSKMVASERRDLCSKTLTDANGAVIEMRSGRVPPEMSRKNFPNEKQTLVTGPSSVLAVLLAWGVVSIE